MRKLKDFIYDFNDVLVALVIVIAAAIVILWRVDIVMDYNGYLTGHRTSLREKIAEVDFSDVDLTQEEVENIVEPDDSVLTGSAVTDVTTEPAITTEPAVSEPETQTKPAVEEPVKEPEKELKPYNLEVSKEKGTNTWQAVGSLLEKNGVIESKAAFINRVIERKVDAMLQLGQFNFTTNLTLDEVIDILIK